ncbi:unnamed protein product [Staurois parvus]|uniref:Uncharacterized protein n=1 Tax=Staurois parvus TaxID=386267 RepID=A0ABN9GZR5_9NEOB|nr:unnamed protein product [Staurois parvus]
MQSSAFFSTSKIHEQYFLCIPMALVHTCAVSFSQFPVQKKSRHAAFFCTELHWNTAKLIKNTPGIH